MNTLLLDQDFNDICLDASGNIAVASEPYSLAQDVASAIRTFLAECWYDTTLGVPYFQQILGLTPPTTLIEEYMAQAALTVPGVVTATCIIESFSPATRTVQGQVLFTDNSGATGAVKL